MTRTTQNRPAQLAERATRSMRNHEVLALLRCCDPLEQESLRRQLMEENIPVADAIAARYASRGIASEDLQQVARLALVRAARAFRPELELDFLSYAVPCITGELRRHFRDAGWVVRPPRRVQEAQYLLRPVRNSLAETLGREATCRELAAAANLDVSTVIEALTVDGCFHPESLDRPVNTQDGSHLTVGDRLSGGEDEYERSEARVILQPLIAELPDRDAHIVHLRFYQGLTQREVGEEVGVTQMQVSRILNRVLAALRQRLDPNASGSKTPVDAVSMKSVEISRVVRQQRKAA